MRMPSSKRRGRATLIGSTRARRKCAMDLWRFSALRTPAAQVVAPEGIWRVSKEQASSPFSDHIGSNLFPREANRSIEGPVQLRRYSCANASRSTLVLDEVEFSVHRQRHKVYSRLGHTQRLHRKMQTPRTLEFSVRSLSPVGLPNDCHCAAALFTPPRTATIGAHPRRGYAQRAPSDRPRSVEKRLQKPSVTNGVLEGSCRHRTGGAVPMRPIVQSEA
jgi:hypothetical protein